MLNKIRQTHKKRKLKKSSVVVLCSTGLVFVMAAGLFLHGAAQSNGSVQVATVGKPITAPVVEQESQPEPTPEEYNPYGVDPTKPMVALTFDDGPSKHTWAIVDALKSHNARATFFVLGNRVPSYQAAIDNMLANHNEIGSHSMGHANLAKLTTEEEITAQIRPVDEALQKQHAYTPKLFRVPYGSKNDQVLAVLKAEGKPYIGWSVDPRDWDVKDKNKVVNHVLANVKDGDIILMHDIYEPTAEAVAELVPALQEQGYQLVTVSELFQLRGVTPLPGVYYRNVPPQTFE